MRARCAERARPPTSAARALLGRASALAAVAASAARAAAASMARAAAAARAASPPPSPLPLHPTRRATASPSPSPPRRPPSQRMLLDGVRTTLRPMGARAPPRARRRAPRALPTRARRTSPSLPSAAPPLRTGPEEAGGGRGGAGSGVRGVVASTIPLGWSVGRHAHSERIPSDQNLGKTGGDCRRVAAHRVEISGHFMHWRGLACGPAGSACARACRARTDFCPLCGGAGRGGTARAPRAAPGAPPPSHCRPFPPRRAAAGERKAACRCVCACARACARARERAAAAGGGARERESCFVCSGRARVGALPRARPEPPRARGRELSIARGEGGADAAEHVRALRAGGGARAAPPVLRAHARLA